jgi:hypothetical protein
LTQRRFYVALVGKDEILLSPEEYELLKQSSLQGINQVWFSDKMLSIPHISRIEERVESHPDLPQLPDVSKEQREANSKRLQKMKSEFIKKHGVQ